MEENHHSKKIGIDLEEPAPKKIITKRKSFHSTPKTNEIYLKNSKRFSIYLNRAIFLFNQGHQKIMIHALGSTINKAVKLALKLEEIYAGISFNIKTSTVSLIDDVIIKDNQIESETQIRANSAIHIEISKSS